MTGDVFYYFATGIEVKIYKYENYILYINKKKIIVCEILTFLNTISEYVYK